MAYIQSTINARSCCVMFLSFFFSSSSCSQSFICSTFFLCREIPENVLVDNYWRFHTMNYNSRKSNFYDSHAQREMTLACSEDTEQWWLYCRDERGGGGLTYWHVVWVRCRQFLGWKYRSLRGAVTYSRAERRSTQQESDSVSPHNLGLASETPV